MSGHTWKPVKIGKFKVGHGIDENFQKGKGEVPLLEIAVIDPQCFGLCCCFC